jgi:hypothetical protein
MDILWMFSHLALPLAMTVVLAEGFDQLVLAAYECLVCTEEVCEGHQEGTRVATGRGGGSRRGGQQEGEDSRRGRA